MNQASLIQKIIELINKHSVFAVALPSNPTPDAISAGVGLYLGLTKMGKHATLASASPTVDTFGLTGGDKLQTSLASGGENLVISFPYVEGSIDKVTYTIEGARFNLLIIPRDESKKISPEQVEYNYAGGKVDAVFVIDTPNLTALGSLYEENKDQFTGKDVINIDRHLTNGNFGTVNFVQKNASSTSELILALLSNAGVQLDKDIATALYTGISAATNNFTSYSVNAQTMETAGYLLKSGAVKKQLPQSASAAQMGQQPPQQRGAFGSQPPIGAVGAGGAYSYPQRPSYPPPARPAQSYSGMSPQASQPPQPFPQQSYQPRYDNPTNQFGQTTPPPQQPFYGQPNDAVNFPDGNGSEELDSQSKPEQSQAPMGSLQDTPRQQPSYQSSAQHEAQYSHVDQSVDNKEVQQGQQANEGQQASESEQESEDEHKKAPKEWLKPKIFKGSNLV